MDNSRAGHYAISAFLFVSSAVYLLSALSIESDQEGNARTLGAAALPVTASVGMMVLSVVLAIQTLTGKNDVRALEGDAEEQIARGRLEPPVAGRRWIAEGLRSPLFFMGATVIYVLLVPLVGFFVATAAFMLASFALLGVLSWVVRLAVTAGFLLFAYLLFVRVLLVSLPSGPWGF